MDASNLAHLAGGTVVVVAAAVALSLCASVDVSAAQTGLALAQRVGGPAGGEKQALDQLVSQLRQAAERLTVVPVGERSASERPADAARPTVAECAQAALARKHRHLGLAAGAILHARLARSPHLLDQPPPMA